MHKIVLYKKEMRARGPIDMARGLEAAHDVLPLGEGVGEPSDDSAIPREFVLTDSVLVLAFECGGGNLRVRKQMHPRPTSDSLGALDDTLAVDEAAG